MKDGKDLVFLRNIAFQFSDERKLVQPKKFYRSNKFRGLRFHERNNTYVSGNGILAFSSGGKIYLLPDSIRYLKMLWLNNFVRSDTFEIIPSFSLKDEEGKRTFVQLRDAVKASQQTKFRSDCLNYSSTIGLKKLPEPVFQYCVRVIPGGTVFEGITFYPILATDFFDSFAANKIGYYAQVKHCIVFVYVDGNTYVSSNSGVQSNLNQCGFKKCDWFYQ